MTQVPYTRQAIEEVIKEHGPLTIAQVAVLLPKYNPKAISASILYGHKRNKAGVRFFYICGYERSLGTGGRLAPIYALGDKPDKKPIRTLTPLERTQRYHARHKTVIELRKARKKGEAVDPWLLPLIGTLNAQP